MQLLIRMSDEEMQDFVGKDGFLWQKLSTFQTQRGRMQQQNVVNIRPGPTAFATTRVVEGRPSSELRLAKRCSGIFRNVFLKLNVLLGMQIGW